MNDDEKYGENMNKSWSWQGISVTLETITPEIAEEYLKLNDNNRNPKEAKIRQYADDIANGAWRLNGETLKFSRANRLLDGQNRLLAVIVANKPITTLVVHGLDDLHDQMTMDVGAARNYADVLRLRGMNNSANIAAAIRGLHAWTHGVRNFSGGSAISNARLDETLRKYPEIVDNVNEFHRIYRHTGIPIGILAGLWWQFFQIDESDAEFFFDRLCSDELHEEGSPIFALRRYLQNLERSTHKPDRTQMAALTIKAWNAYRSGAVVRNLSWRPGGASPEMFPEPK